MPTRLTQAQLDILILKHETYRLGRPGGGRIALANHDLSQLVLSERDLSHGDFTGAALVEANLSKSKLDYCQFYAADMRRANLRHASMIRADLRGARLRGASLNNADLTDADLREGSFASYDPKKGISFSSDHATWKEGAGGCRSERRNLVISKIIRCHCR